VITLFLFSLVVIGLPVLVSYADPSLRRAGWGWAIPALGFSLGGICVAAGLLHPVLPYGWSKLFIVEVFVTLWVWWALRHVPARAPKIRWRLFALAAFVLLADSLIIYLRQGWHLEGFFLGEGPGYFRMPFHEDMMRNVSVVTSLLRGNESPFLAGAPIAYQTFWFQFPALCVGLFRPVSYYPLVLGCSLATGWLFFLTALYAGFSLRPALFSRARFALPVLFVWLFHVDLGNGLYSLWRTGQWAMEADWSMTHVSHFRYLSPKFLSLVGPQHTLFLLFFLSALIFRSQRSRFVVGEVAATLFAFFTGPILFVMGFPLLWWYTRPVDWKRVGLTLLAGLAAFGGIYGFPPTWIWIRPGSTGFTWLPALGWQWALVPVLPLLSLGLAGLGLSFLAYRRGKAGLLGVLPCFLFLIFFNALVSSPEIGRHATMIAMVVAGWLLTRWARPWETGERTVWLGLATLAILGQGFLLYSYTLKPNLLRADIPWRDYFAMNQVLRTSYPDIAVVSAIGTDLGIAKPVVGEAATSFAQAIDAVTHSRTEEPTRRLLKVQDREKEILPFARQLGYRAVVWGPAEREMWGERSEKRFIDPKRKIAEIGKVGLYEIGDRIFEAHEKQRYASYESSATALADRLSEAGWRMEAIDMYLSALQKDADFQRAHLGLGKTLEAMGMHRSAKNHFDRLKTYK